MYHKLAGHRGEKEQEKKSERERETVAGYASTG
jgi:hypothetical protein